MKNKSTKSFNGYSVAIILAVIFGLAGGFVSTIIAKVYVLDNIYTLPLFGKIDFSNQNHNGSNIVIKGAEKVIVEQEIRVAKIIVSTRNSIVGIYKKKNVATTDLKKGVTEERDNYKFDINNFYNLSNEAGQGLIITSDGWMISNIDLKNANKDYVIKNYIIIANNGKLYEIDNILNDSLTKFSFLHAKEVNDFNVIQFSPKDDMQSGKILVYNNWDNEVALSTIASLRSNELLVKSSDKFFDKLEINKELNDKNTGFLFNLKGNLVGLIESNESIIPVTHFTAVIEYLFRNKEISRSQLGINYVDFNELVIAKQDDVKIQDYLNKAIVCKNNKGVSIEKNSPAFKAGFKENDIIISVDNIELNSFNNLTYLIQSYLPDQTISIEYVRNGKKQEIKLKLDGIK